MPVGEQSTRRVSDDLAPIGVVAVHDETLGFANCTKPQRFITDEFILREAIMHLYDVDGLRSDPRGVERSLRSSARHAEPYQLPHVTSFEGSCRVRRHRLGPNSHPSVQAVRSEEQTSELQSLMRISYAVFCYKHTI